uniref:Transmembrane protease serine 3 n=1 Tax=Bactrocera latifrons TaxID=174628 RepID=A0A0K8TZL4_BACLA
MSIMEMWQLKCVMWAVMVLQLNAASADSGYSYQPPYNQNAALPQENGYNTGYYYPPPTEQAPAQNFSGYFYPRPPARIPTISAESQADSTEPIGTPPPGVMGDFIDDIINAQKEQILSSVLGGSDLEDGEYTDDDSSNLRFKKCADCTCGVPNENRIVGGTVVQTNKYPWTAQILMRGFLYCGGTLINNLYVLTAAHCVTGQKVMTTTVRLLQTNRSPKNMGIMRSAVSFAIHKKYNTDTLIHDIALIELNKPVPLKDPIRPACLPRSRTHNFDFKEAIVAGWGLTTQDGSVSSVLREVTVPIITNAQCRATSYKSMIKATMLCAGHVGEGGKDACQGDSGGPLIVRDGIFRLAGVVSFGYGCARPNAPGIYTRVSHYLEWIAANTRNACYCSK